MDAGLEEMKATVKLLVDSHAAAFQRVAGRMENFQVNGLELVGKISAVVPALFGRSCIWQKDSGLFSWRRTIRYQSKSSRQFDTKDFNSELPLKCAEHSKDSGSCSAEQCRDDCQFYIRCEDLKEVKTVAEEDPFIASTILDLPG